MSVFSYHLVRVSLLDRLKMLVNSNQISGLIHSETMNVMTLGAPIFSWKRMMIKQVAFFAQWESVLDLENFLKNHSTGKIVQKGWHVQLKFVRKWGSISKFDIPENESVTDVQESRVVAVTLARMRFLQIPRFIRWGRPTEQLVRDHPGKIVSLASISLPNLVSTFSIWKNQEEMTNMVHGHSHVNEPKRHSDAMKERTRKDFHYEFITLRFIPIAEFGEWKGQRNFCHLNLGEK